MRTVGASLLGVFATPCLAKHGCTHARPHLRPGEDAHTVDTGEPEVEGRRRRAPSPRPRPGQRAQLRYHQRSDRSRHVPLAGRRRGGGDPLGDHLDPAQDVGGGSDLSVLVVRQAGGGRSRPPGQVRAGTGRSTPGPGGCAPRSEPGPGHRSRNGLRRSHSASAGRPRSARPTRRWPRPCGRPVPRGRRGWRGPGAASPTGRRGRARSRSPRAGHSSTGAATPTRTLRNRVIVSPVIVSRSSCPGHRVIASATSPEDASDVAPIVPAGLEVLVGGQLTGHRFVPRTGSASCRATWVATASGLRFTSP